MYHLFDGSTDQQEQTEAWDPLMRSCGRKTNNWRTYAAVVWEDNRDYDRSNWYSTWLSAEDAKDVPYDGLKVLGDGEGLVSENDCMSTFKFYEMSFRGHANNFIGLYIEDPSCPSDTPATMPSFVRCVGPGAIIPEDGASCTCGANSSWNANTEECECDDGYLGSTQANWQRNPTCHICSGVGAYVDHYGNCKCGDGAVLNGSNCYCPDGTVEDSLSTFCYDGIDQWFNKDLYTCETEERDQLLEDLGYTFGLEGAEHRIGVDCDTFGYSVIQVDTVGNNAVGGNSGIQPSFRPDAWQNNPIRSATIRQAFGMILYGVQCTLGFEL